MEEKNTLDNLKNIKLTNARREILNILSNSEKPLSYENIKEFISMDKATFYRNIAFFEEENIINSFEANDKKKYFEIKDKEHFHFICSNCSKIECLFDIPKIEIDGYKIENIILKGICKECNCG